MVELGGSIRLEHLEVGDEVRLVLASSGRPIGVIGPTESFCPAPTRDKGKRGFRKVHCMRLSSSVVETFCSRGPASVLCVASVRRWKLAVRLIVFDLRSR